jgi:hypothetical protein
MLGLDRLPFETTVTSNNVREERVHLSLFFLLFAGQVDDRSI